MHWQLPTQIVAAIAGHHVPDASLHLPLVPVVHLAEVLSHALDLAGEEDGRIGYVSVAACEQLGIVWDASIRPLLGRIDARSRHASGVFTGGHPP